jgi:hypothetical protein
MSQLATTDRRAPPAPRAQRRASYAWFGFMVGSWAVFFVLLAASHGTLERLWGWVRGLPLVLELGMWVLMLPWLLGLAVWQSSWDGWLRLLVVAGLALGWSLISWPRAPAGRGREPAAG